MRKFAFLWWKIIVHKQQCTRMCRGVACKPGRQESVISKASLHADHPPMCVKLLCKCTMISYCNASLCKKVRHYFSHNFVWFTLNSTWAKSHMSLCESAQRRGSHDLLCFYINTLRPSDKFMHRWFVSSLVKTTVCNIFGAKPLSKPVETCWIWCAESNHRNEGPMNGV